MEEFEILSDCVELRPNGEEAVLYERHYFKEGSKVIEYYSKDSTGAIRNYVATKDPEKLTVEERHRVLDYTLPKHDEDEIVNYLDLFLQGEFIEELHDLSNDH